MTKRAARYIVYSSLFLVLAWFLYQRSDYRKLRQTDKIYKELKHPEWSERMYRHKWTTPSGGSGDHRMLYLADVRTVSNHLADAVAYYEKETDRLGFRECHVDGYSSGTPIQGELERYGLEGSLKSDIVVILQAFTSNSTIRHHEPAEQSSGAKGD